MHGLSLSLFLYKALYLRNNNKMRFHQIEKIRLSQMLSFRFIGIPTSFRDPDICAHQERREGQNFTKKKMLSTNSIDFQTTRIYCIVLLYSYQYFFQNHYHVRFLLSTSKKMPRTNQAKFRVSLECIVLFCSEIISSSDVVSNLFPRSTCMYKATFFPSFACPR